MGNLLTPGLLAAAFMAAANIVMGNDAISWNVFMAAIVAMLLNLDMGESRAAAGSPLAHSVGAAVAVVYCAGVLAYALGVLYGLQASAGIQVVLAVASGTAAHLLAELATGQCIYTLPKKLDPETWLEECGSASDRFWGAWGRLSLGKRHLGDVHLNAFSVATVLLCIWLGGTAG